MNQDPKIIKQSFIPVILGGDIGVYSIARTFHEAYGTKSVIICSELIGPTKSSVIIQPIVEPNSKDDHSLLKCLNQIQQTYSGIPKMLIGVADAHVDLIVNIRDRLEEEWVIPYTTREIIDSVSDKANFYKCCEELNIDYPKYITFNVNSAEELDLPFKFPVVIKPDKTVSYKELNFPGKKKVFVANNTEQFERILSLIRGAEYKDDMIIQEYIPGDDSFMHILTLYTAQDGQTKLASFGQTLLEDHTPGGIGNPVAIRTCTDERVIEQAMRLVEHVGYVGFSNFDLKYDSRDGIYKFFELNPRLGRSNYYVTAEGHNTAEYYVKDYLYHEPMVFSIAEKEIVYSIVPKRLLLNNIKDKELKKHIQALYKSRLVKNPQNYFPVERGLRRLLYVLTSTLNFYRKFKKHPQN